ncbi:hypothetical protein ACCC98_00130 [Rhizobium pisi]|uniref:DUF6990 domain-containing protein n=1 Tax=Rhizobium pisi TaxID=574561 RepID=UPI0039AFDC59
MNILETKALQIFKALEWKTHRESVTGDAVLSLDDGDSELHVVVQIRQLPSEQKMTLHLATGSKEISQIIGGIVGNRASHEILLQTHLEKRSLEIGLKEIEDVSKEAINWWQSQDNLVAIKALAAPPQSTGLSQLMHLGALAYLGDFNTLIDYQEVFRKGKRLNFVPMIKPEMIDRAVDIAVERA